MVEISAETFPKNCIHAIKQSKKRKRTSFADKNLKT